MRSSTNAKYENEFQHVFFLRHPNRTNGFGFFHNKAFSDPFFIRLDSGSSVQSRLQFFARKN